jgi:ribosomal protein S27AE
MRRIGLGVFFASVAINATLGIYAVLTPDFGDTQGKILATSLFVTGAVLVALANEPAWERGLLTPVPHAGALLGVLGFGLAVVGIWVEPADDPYGRIMGTTFTLAAASTAAGLLALARLASHHRWVFALTLGLLALGAALMVVNVWWEDSSEIYLRGMGVVLIALAAFAVTVPVLHWVDRAVLAVDDAAIGGVRFCPHCGGKLIGETGVELACGRCGRAFTVTPRVST